MAWSGLLRCRPDAIWHAVVNPGDIRPVPVVSASTMTRNGNATLAKRFTTKGMARYKCCTTPRVTTMGMVHPSSMHNLLLRYWLAWWY